MYSKLTIADVTIMFYCLECDETKENDEIETFDDRITTQYGSYTKTTGNCSTYCKQCGNEIEITYDI